MSRWLIGMAMAGVAAVAQAQTGCSASVMARLDSVDRIAGSLHPDKPGQMRVFARDGSVYSGGQILWMQGQLRRAARLCARMEANNQAQAALVIGEIETLVQAHARLRPAAP
jgi:hypothetical protein